MGDFGDAFNRNDNSPAAVQARTKAQNRANVMQLKLIGQSHPTGLTNNLLKLFEPRPPLEFKPPPEKRKCPPYTGMAHFVGNFAEKGDPEYQPPVQKGETPAERKARIHTLRLEEGAKKAAEELEKYDPNTDPNISGDPYKTLFVARLNYETSESKVKREFEAYGPIKRVRLVTDKETNKPRGYAFIEYMHTRDMKAAYKQADGKKLDNRRVLVDVERGRTVPNWRPRRLGGGLGTTRVGGEDLNQKHSGREIQQSGGPSRSEEPRVREERQGEREREKSRERGREREQEKSRERSHDRPRDRDHREDRHHRDRDRNREKDRERDRGRDRERGRDRDRGRDRGSGRDYERERDRERDRDRPRERDRERDRNREKDYEVGEGEHDRGRSRDKDYDYDRVESKHERDRHGVERERNYDPLEPEEDDPEWYQQHRDHGHKRSEAEHDDHGYEFYQQDRGKYDNLDVKEAAVDHRHYDHPDRDQYDQMEEDNYPNERATSEQREKERSRVSDREYVRSERSLSREYEY
ncbi:U1 small nuclear ribonucleoprotein 70 kDa [Rhododendron vialii]|uniref:U1 small nuclear ribonucleoprotein 70 kDa n=1 Tax=Rhododendron vialii TaxID=182163 RepID=UPI00265E59B7|nr:U1 small nuclear ribonucleoprotein 70 kDa [Rhododendron vialii]